MKAAKAAILCLGLALTAGACKKGNGGPGGGNPPPSGWSVGVSGLMANVRFDGSFSGYPLDTTEDLNGIACRGANEAWVVGNNGTVLFTRDAGTSWETKQVPTTAHLRTLATQDAGPVFLAGDGAFLVSTDTGATWRSLGDGEARFTGVAAAQQGTTVLAVSEGGDVWAYEGGELIKRTTVAGARAVAVSLDGQTAVLVGNDMIARSSDAGRTWSGLLGGEAVRYNDVRIDENGEAFAVGTNGAVAHIAANGAVAIQHLGTAELHTIHLAQPNENGESLGYTGGEGGQIWRTDDGGMTWSQGPNLGRTIRGVDEVGNWHR